MDVEESCTETSTFPNRNLPYSYGKFIALFAIFSAVSLMLTTITLENFPSATLFKQTQTSDAVNGMKAQENDKYDVIYAASSPTVSPITKKPTRDPTTQKPTEDPTSKRPTENPTHKPTQKPTATPSEESTSSPTYSSDTPPGELFNLTTWELQMPINSTGGFSGLSYGAFPLTDYVDYPYFYTGSEGEMVMYTPCNGARVSSCSHPRCEMAEANATTGDQWWWNISTTYASMEAILKVNRLGQIAAGGNSTVIVGQIHGVSGTECRLYYNENGTMYWEASIPKSDDNFYSSESADPIFLDGNRDLYTYEYLTSSGGDHTSIPLNSEFKYHIQSNTSHVTATVWYDDVKYTKSLPILFTSEPVHFKAGCYCQCNDITGNADYGEGACQVSFYGLTKTFDFIE